MLVGCCSYPARYSADASNASAKAVIASPTKVEAYLGASMSRSTLNPPIHCPPTGKADMAPVSQPDANGIVHFGAFAVRHGQSNEHVTVFWWNVRGHLQTYHVTAPPKTAVTFLWINEHTIRFQLGQKTKAVRLNEDDGPAVTEL